MNRRYLLDTNAVGDLLNRRRGVDVKARAIRQTGAIIGTCEPVVGELFFGAENSASRDASIHQLRLGLRAIRAWPFDRRASEEFGRLHVVLRRAGRSMQVVDVQLAAVALALGDCTVVTTDTDLKAVPGLAVEDWTA
jgi:tRNA(fMet)-specific endonuclease VapC